MAEEKQGIFKRIGTFASEVKQEVRKVTWPTRSELYGGTIVLVVVAAILCAALGGVDAVMSRAMEIIMSN